MHTVTFVTQHWPSFAVKHFQSDMEWMARNFQRQLRFLWARRGVACSRVRTGVVNNCMRCLLVETPTHCGHLSELKRGRVLLWFNSTKGKQNKSLLRRVIASTINFTRQCGNRNRRLQYQRSIHRNICMNMSTKRLHLL